MLKILLTGQLKEKPTYRVLCLCSSFVHDNYCPPMHMKHTWLSTVLAWVCQAPLIYLCIVKAIKYIHHTVHAQKTNKKICKHSEKLLCSVRARSPWVPLYAPSRRPARNWFCPPCSWSRAPARPLTTCIRTPLVPFKGTVARDGVYA